MGFFTPTGPEAGKVSASSSLRSHKCQSLEQRNEQGNSHGRETSWDKLQSWQYDTSALYRHIAPQCPFAYGTAGYPRHCPDPRPGALPSKNIVCDKISDKG